MIDRRTMLKAAGAGLAMIPTVSISFAATSAPFSRSAFAEAQKANRPILIEVHASWCPTCRAQAPIISELIAQPQYKNLAVFRVDFDGQRDDVRALGAQAQSTLIVFKGATEVGRSVGDTRRDSIAALLGKSV